MPMSISVSVSMSMSVSLSMSISMPCLCPDHVNVHWGGVQVHVHVHFHVHAIHVHRSPGGATVVALFLCSCCQCCCSSCDKLNRFVQLTFQNLLEDSITVLKGKDLGSICASLQNLTTLDSYAPYMNRHKNPCQNSKNVLHNNAPF